MARPLVLKVKVDDKGNPVLENMAGNVTKLNGLTKGLGKTLTRVFASATMLTALNKFRQGVGMATKEVFEFNRTFKQIEGITGTGGKALEDLKRKTLDVSNATEHTTSNISKAVLSISKMGFETGEALAVIPHIADLATSSMVDLDEAARVAVQTMKSYNMEAEDMEHITNVIQGTVSKTAINFDEFSESLKFVAPIAKNLKIELEETAAMIGKLGDVGLKGSIAGTTLKNMFLNIMKPSDDVKKVLMDLNVEGKGFNEILRAINNAGIPVSSFLETFNKRAVAGSLALSKMTDATDLLTEALKNDEIKASDVAAKVREAWIPQLETLRNVFVNTFVVMGEILDNSDLGLGIEDITKKIIEFQKWLQKNPEILINIAKEIANVVKMLAKLGTDGFIFAMKHGDVLFKLLSSMIALDLAKRISLWASGMARFGRQLGNASGAMAGMHGGLLLVIGALQTAIILTDRWVADLEKVQKVTTDTSLEGMERKLNALKKFQAEMMVPSQARTVKGSIFGTDFVEDTKVVETQLQKIKRIAREVGTEFGIDPKFFEGFKDVSAIISGLEKQIDKMKASLEKTKTKLPDPEKFKVPGLAEDAATDYAEAFMKFLELKLEGKSEGVARALAGFSLDAAKLLGEGETIGGLTGPEISGLGKLTPGFEQTVGGLPVTGESLETADIPNLSKQTEDAIKLAAHEVHILKIQEERLEIIDALIEKYEEEIEAIDRLQEAQDVVAEVQAANAEAQKERVLDQVEGFRAAAQVAVDMIQMLQDNQFAKMQAKHKAELKMLDERAQREISNAKGNAFKQAIIARKMAKERKKLEDEQAKVEKEQKEKQKRWAMIEVGINTAVGVTQALRGMTPPASIVMAAIIAAMGLAQLAVISSQDSFAKGGFTGSGNPADVAGVVHKEEFVIPHEDVRALGGAAGIQQMIDERIEDVTAPSRSVFLQIDTFIGTEEFKRELFVDIQKESQRWQ